MDGDGEAEALSRGLRALATLVDHAPLDVQRFARLNSMTVKRAQDIMQAYEICGYARRMPHRELYVLTPMAMNLVGVAAAIRKAH